MGLVWVINELTTMLAIFIIKEVYFKFTNLQFYKSMF